MKTFNTIAVIVMALAFASCGADGSSFENMVPQDALMVVYAPNPSSLLRDIGDFMAASGLGGAEGALNLEEKAFSLLKLDSATAAGLFNLSKPSGVVLAGQLPEGMEFSALVAVKKADDAKAWLEAALGPSVSVEGPYAGYLVIRPTAQEPQAWPPAQHVKPGDLGQANAHRLTLGINYSAFFANPSMAALMDQSYSSMPGMSALTWDMMKTMGWVSFGLGADKTALSATMSMRIDPATEYGRLVGSIAGARPGMVGRLVAEEVLGVASNVRATDTAGYAAYMKTMFVAMGLDSPDTLMASIEKVMKSAGGDAYSSIDLAPEGPLDAIDDLLSLGFSMSGVATVSDAGAIRQEMGPLLEAMAGTVNSLVSSALGAGATEQGSTPGSFRIGFAVQKDRKGASVPADSYRPTITANGVDAQSARLLRSFGTAFETTVGYGKTRLAYGMGMDSLASMEAALAGTVSGTPLNGVPGFAPLFKLMDPDAMIVGHFNVARLANALGTALGMPFALEEKAPGFLFSASYTKDALRTDFAIGPREFGDLVRAVTPLFAGGQAGK